jgi:KDO2-lipid IV(A) lauroyltransferase
MSRLVLFFMWLIHFLPLAVVAAIGNALGWVLYWLIAERRRVTRINLAKCFPQLSGRERERLSQAHFRIFVRSFFERGILRWSDAARLDRLVRVEGLEILDSLEGRPVILLAPHFVGVEFGGLRLAMDRPMVTMFSRQKDPAFDAFLYTYRTRFGGLAVSRQEGYRKAVRQIRQGWPYYYMPDLDFGPKRSIFVPFFNVSAATVTGLSYIARLTKAAVVPCVTRMLPGGGGYVIRLYPAWTDFPSGDVAADTRRMMAFIEERVLEMPEQYFWLHKRFKTRPAGEAGFYE